MNYVSTMWALNLFQAVVMLWITCIPKYNLFTPANMLIASLLSNCNRQICITSLSQIHIRKSIIFAFPNLFFSSPHFIWKNIGELDSTCVFNSEFGFTFDCKFAKTSLFRVRNLGGAKAHFGFGNDEHLFLFLSINSKYLFLSAAEIKYVTIALNSLLNMISL